MEMDPFSDVTLQFEYENVFETALCHVVHS